jgi:hypothetical protein
MTNNQAERWEPVGVSEDYEVSDMGRIRSSVTGQIKEPTFGSNGAALVNLKIGSSWSVRCVSVLVAEAFLAPRPAGHMVVHRDGDRTNTALSNLGYLPLGKRVPNNPKERGRYLVGKLDSKRAQEIRQRARAGECGRGLAEEYGISASLVSEIKNGSKWAGRPQMGKSKGE